MSLWLCSTFLPCCWRRLEDSASCAPQCCRRFVPMPHEHVHRLLFAFRLGVTLDFLHRKFAGTPRKTAHLLWAARLAAHRRRVRSDAGKLSGLGADPRRLAEYHDGCAVHSARRRSVPAEAMIYQLPYGLFPGGNQLRSFALLSSCPVAALELSGDAWPGRRPVESRPDRQAGRRLVATLIFAGFQGHIHRSRRVQGSRRRFRGEAGSGARRRSHDERQRTVFRSST